MQTLMARVRLSLAWRHTVGILAIRAIDHNSLPMYFRWTSRIASKVFYHTKQLYGSNASMVLGIVILRLSVTRVLCDKKKPKNILTYYRYFDTMHMKGNHYFLTPLMVLWGNTCTSSKHTQFCLAVILSKLFDLIVLYRHIQTAFGYSYIVTSR